MTGFCKPLSALVMLAPMNEPKIFDDNAQSIGGTPLVRINRLAAHTQATVLAKLEGRNPAYSVKCRIGAAMIWDAEARGLLTPGKAILEATSGNTGIALAFAAAARGVPCTLVMPETMSMERRKVLVAFGATLILTPGAQGMRGAIARAEAMAAAEPTRYVLMQQFNNPANPAIHARTTGPEIWEAVGGRIDALICGVGTGGTITGVSRYIKQQQGHPLVSVAVEPSASPILAQTRAGQPLASGPHKIQGIGAGFVPKNLDMALVDRIEGVSNEAAIAMGRRLAQEEGMLVGISCGAAMVATLRLAEEPAFAGKTLVTVLPDAGERYLSGPLFAEMFTDIETRQAQA